MDEHLGLLERASVGRTKETLGELVSVGCAKYRCNCQFYKLDVELDLSISIRELASADKIRLLRCEAHRMTRVQIAFVVPCSYPPTCSLYERWSTPIAHTRILGLRSRLATLSPQARSLWTPEAACRGHNQSSAMQVPKTSFGTCTVVDVRSLSSEALAKSVSLNHCHNVRTCPDAYGCRMMDTLRKTYRIVLSGS